MNPTPHDIVAALGGPTRAAELLFGSKRKQSRVSNWLLPQRRIPAHARVIAAIERLTPYTREQIRPDVYGERSPSEGA